MENNQKGNGFGNGFLLGAIVGGALVFAFGTKKGRRIVKALTEEGIEGVAEISDLMQDYGDMEEELEEDAFVENPEPHAAKKAVKKEEAVEAEMVEVAPKHASNGIHSEKHRSTSSVHRFFKRKR